MDATLSVDIGFSELGAETHGLLRPEAEAGVPDFKCTRPFCFNGNGGGRVLILVMGVAGSGKTLIGAKLAESLHCTFADADSFHPTANTEKMSRGVPLTDEDREPWLAAIRKALHDWQAAGECAVVTCSALKERYREYLTRDCTVRIVYLKGDYDLVHERLASRQGHFMKPGMLTSQFADLEEPANAIVVDIAGTPEEIVAEIRSKLSLNNAGAGNF